MKSGNYTTTLKWPFNPFPPTSPYKKWKKAKKLPVLTYIEGYCCYSINKKLKCGDCNEQIVSSSGNVDDFQFTMMKGLSRGELLYPYQDVIDVVLVCYLTIKKLSKAFYRCSSQGKLAVNICLAVFDGECVMNNNYANFCATRDSVFYQISCKSVPNACRRGAN